MTAPLLAWLYAFAFTELVEAPIYFRLLAPHLPSWRRRLLVGVGTSLATHPVVWFVFPRLIDEPYALMVVAAELFAVMAEAALLRAAGVAVRPAIAVAVVANLTSVTLGFLSRGLFGFP